MSPIFLAEKQQMALVVCHSVYLTGSRLLKRFPGVVIVLLQTFPHRVADLRCDVLGDDAEQEVFLKRQRSEVLNRFNLTYR
jgi:hypothetical protein